MIRNNPHHYQMGGTVSISAVINGQNYYWNGFANLNNSNPNVITASYQLLDSNNHLSNYSVVVMFINDNGKYYSIASLTNFSHIQTYSVRIEYTGLPAGLPSDPIVISSP